MKVSSRGQHGTNVCDVCVCVCASRVLPPEFDLHHVDVCVHASRSKWRGRYAERWIVCLLASPLEASLFTGLLIYQISIINIWIDVCVCVSTAGTTHLHSSSHLLGSVSTNQITNSRNKHRSELKLAGRYRSLADRHLN
jgi:hypothetical protein